MPNITREQIESAIASYQDPYLKQDLISAKALRAIHLSSTQVELEIVLGFPLLSYKPRLEEALHALLAPLTSLPVQIKITTQIATHVGVKGLKAIPHIKNIIAVASGKGGVGKSTTSVNLALALAKEGAQVGILDADIYGPSQPMMLGVTERPAPNPEKILYPIIRHGLQSMSIGYLISEDSAMIWRGPMVSTALQQLLNDTHWDALDYLIIDLPPGTGDIQLTLAQKIPVSGVVVVTTPQDLALLDAKRAYQMFQKVSIPVLGLVENMSQHVCTHCGHHENTFGHGGGERMAHACGIDFLGALPLDVRIREQTDGGMPTVISDPNGPNTLIYTEIALQLAAKLSLQAVDYSHKFPPIVRQ